MRPWCVQRWKKLDVGNMKPFVIICQARSGSTMLGSALSRHPQVIMHGEIFGAHHFPLNFYGIDENLPWPTPIEIILKKARDRNPGSFLEEFVFADTARARSGFKFKFEEFDIWPQVRDYIIANKMPIILLRRSNLLDRYLSEIEAEYSGFFNTTDKTTYGAMTKEEVFSKLTIGQIRLSIDKSREYQRTFSELFAGNPVFDLTYEDLTHNWHVKILRVCDFLGIAGVDLAPLTEKRAKRRLIDELCDVETTRRTLSEIGYTEFLQ